MDKHEILRLAAIEAAKGAPPTTVAIASKVENWTMANTLTALTILYIALQIAWLIWQWRQASKRVRDTQGSQEAQHG